MPRNRVADATMRYLANPPDGGCVARWSGAGASIGGGIGVLGLAGGPIVGLTEPGMIGFGGLAFAGVGSVACRGNAAGGGGGGSGGGNRGRPLKELHDDSSFSKASLEFWRKKSTREIVDSLNPGQAEALRVKPDGTIMNGNTRIQILRERGFDVNLLPREPF